MQRGRKHVSRWRFSQIAVVLALTYRSAYSENRCSQEMTANFWDTNLVATVIGYSSERTFMGVNIPVMDPLGQSAREVWLYSVAPTNYRGITFSMHSCGLFGFSKMFPTNQLFVFPASPAAGYNSCTNLFYPIYSEFQTFRDYCPYKTYCTWFPVTDSDVQYWISDWRDGIGEGKTKEIKLRSELAKTNDDRKRSNIAHRIEREEELIHKCQRAIDEAQIQSTFFPGRIQWLKTQGVYPTQ